MKTPYRDKNGRFISRAAVAVLPRAKWSVQFRGFAVGWHWWWQWWTPSWHAGRGPYVSIGLGVISIYRGY